MFGFGAENTAHDLHSRVCAAEDPDDFYKAVKRLTSQTPASLVLRIYTCRCSQLALTLQDKTRRLHRSSQPG